MGQDYLQRDRHFFDQRDQQSRRSAQAVVPIVMELVKPASVIDLGCGVGTWLAIFQEAGAREVMGVEAGEVDASLLRIDASCFRRADLSKPFTLDRRFDLAMSLEVAEHLPPESADDFVASLARLAPVVLFSAAVPQQGGIHHVNEQWPQYWVERFAGHGYAVVDAIRPRIWHEPTVQPWYAQNTFLYVHRARLETDDRLQATHRVTRMEMLDLIHPRYAQWKADDTARLVRQARELTLGDVARRLPTLLRRSIASRWRRAGRDTHSSNDAPSP